MTLFKTLSIFALVFTFSETLTRKIPKGFRELTSPDENKDSYYFIISPTPVDWYTARQICESIGPYRYVSLQSQEKSEELYLKLSVADVNEAWTCGNDILQNGKYVWGSTPAWLEYQGWRTPTAPNNPDFHCISVTVLAGQCGSTCIGRWGWDEEDCSSLKLVVCEPVEQSANLFNFTT